MPAALPPRSSPPSATVSLKTLLLVFLLLAGGGAYVWLTHRPPSPPPTPALPLVQELGAYRLELTPVPYPLLTGHSATLNFRLTYQGQPLRGAVVHGSAHKPVFSPPVEISFREFRDGEYTADLNPDQPGPWDLHLSYMQEGTRRTASFGLQARD
jgi:hypothetical protein